MKLFSESVHASVSILLPTVTSEEKLDDERDGNQTQNKTITMRITLMRFIYYNSLIRRK